MLDGRPLATRSPAELAARIGYLPQDAYLFSGTVAENITFRAQTLSKRWMPLRWRTPFTARRWSKTWLLFRTG